MIKMKYPCIESTIDIDFINDIIIRLWINEVSLPINFERHDFFIKEVHSRVSHILQLGKFVSDDILNKIAEACASIPHINAVQIIRDRHGIVIYTVDFNDVHG